MLWLLNLLAPIADLYAKWFGAKNSPQVIKAKEINDERKKEQKYKEDLRLAQNGDRAALDRVRAYLAANP